MLQLRGFVKMGNHFFKAAIMSNIYSLTLRHCGVPSVLSCVVTIYITTLFGATAFRSGSWLRSISYACRTTDPLQKFTPSSGCSVAYSRQPHFGHAFWTFQRTRVPCPRSTRTQVQMYSTRLLRERSFWIRIQSKACAGRHAHNMAAASAAWRAFEKGLLSVDFTLYL